ncbi:MAG: MFS transporter [Candidatus Gastranaerophilales bacterium]|nr:MFS transporter [Candidatus Gastranaerophilales bacterium]
MAEANIKAVRWLEFSHFVIDCYPGFIAPMLPFITAKIGIEMAAAMLIISMANISSYLLQPVFGYFADRCQKRFFIFWGIIIASVFIPLMSVAQSFAALSAAIILGEIGVGFFHPQATSFVPIFCKNPEQERFHMGFFLSMGSVAYGVGALVATKIYDVFGEQMLIATSIFGIITAFSMFVFVPKISCEQKEEKKRIHFGEGIKAILSHKIVLTLVFASIVKSIIVSSYTLIMPFYWKNIGLSAFKIGIISCIFLATSTLGMLAAHKIEKLIGSRNTFYFSFVTSFITALATIVLLKVNLYLAIFMYGLLGFLIFITQPVNVVMSQKLLPEYKSLISGFVGGFTWGIVGVMLPVIAFVTEKTDILTTLAFVSAIPLIFCYWVKNIPLKPIEQGEFSCEKNGV